MNFEVTVNILTENEQTGREYIDTELYMVNAMSFGDAEFKAHQYIKSQDKQGRVSAIIDSNVTFVDEFTNEFLYKIKISVPEENEETGKISNRKYYELISADRPEDAIQKTREKYSKYFGDKYDVQQSIKTPFVLTLNY